MESRHLASINTTYRCFYKTTSSIFVLSHVKDLSDEGAILFGFFRILHHKFLGPPSVGFFCRFSHERCITGGASANLAPCHGSCAILVRTRCGITCQVLQIWDFLLLKLFLLILLLTACVPCGKCVSETFILRSTLSKDFCLSQTSCRLLLLTAAFDICSFLDSALIKVANNAHTFVDGRNATFFRHGLQPLQLKLMNVRCQRHLGMLAGPRPDMTVQAPFYSKYKTFVFNGFGIGKIN